MVEWASHKALSPFSNIIIIILGSRHMTSSLKKDAFKHLFINFFACSKTYYFIFTFFDEIRVLYFVACHIFHFSLVNNNVKFYTYC